MKANTLIVKALRVGEYREVHRACGSMLPETITMYPASPSLYEHPLDQLRNWPRSIAGRV